MVGFGINDVEPFCSATIQLIRKMDLNEIDCEDGRWLKLGEDCVQWWGLVLAVLNLCVLLPESVN